MSVNISVSGKTLKECHEQILALANEITGDMMDVATTRTASQSEQISKGNLDGIPTGDPAHAIKQNVVKFNIGPSEAPAITQEVASNPTQTNTATGASVGQTESVPMVDSRGLPWDARIHSSNKEQGKDGVWRRRRGVDPELEKQIEAELYLSKGKTAPGQVKPFGSMSPEQYQQVVAPAPMPTTEHRVALPEVGNVLNQIQTPAQTAPTFAPPPPAQVLPPNTHTQESFRNNLVVILNDLVVANKIDHNWINSQKVQFGGKDITQWSENQAACNSLFDAFVSWGFINKL